MQRSGRPKRARSPAAASWGDDVTELLLRGASKPASRTDPTWAAPLAVTAVGDFIASLAPLSAGAKLLDAAVRVTLDGVDKVNLPGRLAALNAADVAWVSELGAIPIHSFVVGDVALGPMHKLAVITVATRELFDSSAAEVIFRQLLRENAAISLDAALFSNAAATADRPAGLLDGVAALTGTAGGGDGAMLDDLTMLAGAIGTVASGLAYIAHPNQANAIKLRRGALFPADVPVWPTLGVAPGVVIAIDGNALASGFGPEPEFSVSNEAMLQTETAPGADPMAGPTSSLFQIAAIAMKLKLRCAWAWRVAGAVAWVQGAKW